MSIPSKLYLAGPMTGIPQFNFPAFMAAQKDLEERGYEIINPADLDLKDLNTTAMSSTDGKITAEGVDGYTFGDFLARDVKIIADLVGGVVCLPNWENSKGARLEVYVCLISDKPVFAYEAGVADGMFPLSFQYCARTVTARESYNASYKEMAFRKDVG